MPDFAAVLRAAKDEKGGLVAACTAHPVVLDVCLQVARTFERPLLIEATCNQVNQEGGYTGLTPAAFAADLRRRIKRAGLGPDAVVLGGDHLGPNPWRRGPAEAAMANARRLVADYVGAGFTKIHLDASMACADDPTPLPPMTIAKRAAALAAASEAAWRASGTSVPPAYVVGTEVPPPGGAREDTGELALSDPAEVERTLDLHREAFAAAGVADATARIVAIVAQPGVEFGDDAVHRFEPEATRPLTAALDPYPNLVFEAHSTDYQDKAALNALVRARFTILKVGPELTFAYREALDGLDSIEAELLPKEGRADVFEALEAAMLADDGAWRGYLTGDAAAQRLARRFGLSDRCRYYWDKPAVKAAVVRLMQNLSAIDLPPTLVRHAFPDLFAAGAVDWDVTPQGLIEARVRRVIERYARAVR